MHLYVIVKGTVPSMKQWVDDMQGVKVPFEYKPGKKGLWRLRPRPLMLYEIGFPKDQLQTVLSCVGIGDNYILKRYPILNRIVKMLRKLLKLKPIPNTKNIIPHIQPNQIDKAVAVIPIGLKDDEIFPNREQL